MVIILKIKMKKKTFVFPTGAVLLFYFHFSVCSIAVPVAYGVAKLACLLSCLPPEQYTVEVWLNRDVNKKPNPLNLQNPSAWIFEYSDSGVLYCFS